MDTEGSGPGNDKPRAPWYLNPNWLLLLVAIPVIIWLVRLFGGGNESATPGGASQAPATTAAITSVATAVPSPAHIYRKPSSPAKIVQHAHASADVGRAHATDLTGVFGHAPKPGDLLLAVGSAGFGVDAAAGWTLVGGKPTDAVAVAYHIAQANDGKMLIPFTTPRVSSYTLELIEVAGGPDILAGPQVGGVSVATTLDEPASLRIPQTGGILFQFYAASGRAGENGAPTRASNVVPPGQNQSLVDQVAARGWASELIARATTTDPQAAPQPFSTRETVVFATAKPPGNSVAGWLVWVGGRTNPHQE